MTENKQHLVPEIRFKGFTNVWEQRKVQWLIDEGIIEEPMDGNHGEKHPTASEYVDNGIPFLMAKDIKNGIVDIQKCNFITLERSKKLDKGFAKNGDVLITHKATIGEVAILSELSSEYAVLTPQVTYYRVTDKSRLAVKYLYAYFNSPDFQNVLKVEATQSTRSYIGITGQHKLDVKFPTVLKEQEQIGVFFAELDHLITLHKRKLDGLVTLKDGFLQQMFPAANEVMPRVRFAGFTGNWEERRLEEMLTERNEQFEESEDYPLMSFVGNVGVVPKGEQYDRSFLVKGDGKKYKKTELNDFIYSSNNLETGSIGFNRTGKAVISPVYSIFYSSNDSESLFVGLLSKRKDFINKMIHYRQGVMYGQWRIHERDFLKIIVLTPTLSEQNRIIDFFKNFDEQIAAQTAKLEQLRQLKAAYLQRMFI